MRCTSQRDSWIKENIPISCGSEIRIAFEALMRQAYDKGYENAEVDVRIKKEYEERERKYGPDI